MTSIKPKYCSNCGATLENLNYEEIKKCPKCGIDLLQTPYTTPKTSIVDQLPYKSPGTAALIAFIGGIFGLLGIGHIYVGKVGKGIGILIAGIIIAALIVITIMMGIMGPMMGMGPMMMMDPSQMPLIILSFILGIAYLVLWIWQIFNARKLAKKFNKSVRATGKEPW
jgi:TM2 domain-containing membrane protein YozV/DNA-directed RNA polymerase subunit RPC12/RpoP